MNPRYVLLLPGALGAALAALLWSVAMPVGLPQRPAASGAPVADVSPTAARLRFDPSDRERLPLDPSLPGTLRSFRVGVTSRVEMGAQAMTTRIVASMTVLVVDRRGDELLAEVRLPTAQVGIDGTQTAAVVAYARQLASAFDTPTLVRLDRRGRILGFRFAPSLAADQRNWLRTLLCAFAFTVDRERGPSWDGLEADATGAVATNYRLEDGEGEGCTVLRRRIHYPEVPQAQPHGAATAHFDDASPWPCQARVDDSLVLDLPEAGTRVCSRVEGELQLVSVATSEIPAADWAGPWAPVPGALDRSEIADELQRQHWRERLAGVRLEDLLGQLAGVLAHRPVCAEDLSAVLELLTHLVELQPDVTAQLDRFVRDRTSDPGVVGIALGALGRAGTSGAQRLLSACAADAALPSALRRSAIEAMFSVAAPEAGVIRQVGSLLDTAAAFTEVETAAMLWLGACSNRHQVGLADLLAVEPRVVGTDALPRWLEALGNAGSDEGLEIARRYAAAGEEHVRMAAVSALRKVGSAAAVAMLTEVVATDPSPLVRGRAARVLAEGPAAVPYRLLADLAANDADPGVRGVALRGLMRRFAADPSARSLVERRATEDPSPDVRTLAAELLAG